jgi:LysM repeat protein
MKENSKIVLLVVLAFLLVMTACTRQASTAPVSQPSPTADVPFPVSTPGLGAFGTQTAIASTPADTMPTNTAQVTVETLVAPTTDTETGGGVVQPPDGTGGEVAAPTAQVVPAGPIPEVVRPSSYTLQKGEWPICVARRFNLDISTFFSTNGLSMSSKPAAGTVLRIPAEGSWNTGVYGQRALRPHPTTYTVGSGDSIYSIACYYGDVDPSQIRAANNLTSDALTTGTVLQIP